jgi:hypothetical protein
VRPYVSIQFRYNLADLQPTSSNRAKLPLIKEWETARETGRLTGTAQLEKVGNRWYFADFDFMTFPWVLIVVMCLFGVAFAVVVLTSIGGRKSNSRVFQRNCGRKNPPPHPPVTFFIPPLHNPEPFGITNRVEDK